MWGTDKSWIAYTLEGSTFRPSDETAWFRNARLSTMKHEQVSNFLSLHNNQSTLQGLYDSTFCRNLATIGVQCARRYKTLLKLWYLPHIYQYSHNSNMHLDPHCPYPNCLASHIVPKRIVPPMMEWYYANKPLVGHIIRIFIIQNPCIM